MHRHISEAAPQDVLQIGLGFPTACRPARSAGLIETRHCQRLPYRRAMEHPNGEKFDRLEMHAQAILALTSRVDAIEGALRKDQPALQAACRELADDLTRLGRRLQSMADDLFPGVARRID
jgi:hypothetical protein